MDQLISQLDPNNMPAHVAVIMDGNGRWAKARGLDRTAGHSEGVKTVRRITEIAAEVGLKYLTLYTFSTENWNRPQPEIDALMHLIVVAIERETPDLIKNNVRLTMIGDFSRVPKFALDRLHQCIADTSKGTGLTLCVALSYSSRWEITNAARQLAQLAADHKISPDDITPEMVSAHLTTANMPDPDILIRTGGDMRVSNFLLWQIAYSEIFVTPTFWPDFSKKDFLEILLKFQQRERRFGLISEQLADPFNPLKKNS